MRHDRKPVVAMAMMLSGLLANIVLDYYFMGFLGLGPVGAALGTMFAPVTAVSFLVFTLLYTPCVAAITAVRRELGSGWKAAGVALLQCCVAWLTSFVVYHAMLLFV